MPYDPNANWTARTIAAAKDPVYYIAFEGLTTKHFSTAPVRAAAVTKKVLLKVPDSIGQKLSQLQGRASLQTLTFDLVDTNGEITDLVSTEKTSPTLATLVNTKITLYSGYADLNESDYAIYGVGQISAVDVGDTGVTYRIKTVDLKRHQFDDVCTNADATQTAAINTVLSADAAVGATSIFVLNPTDINPSGPTQSTDLGDRLYLGPSSDGGYAGQELKVLPFAVAGNEVKLRSALTKAFKAGDEVRWASSIIEGNPINLIYALWTGDFANGSFPLTKVRGEPTGLGIAAASIDGTWLQRERDRVDAADLWRFELKQSTPGFRFLEQQIFRLIGYPIVTVDGKLGFRLYRPAFSDAAAAGLPTITKADVRSWQWRRAHELHVNKVSLGLDLDAETGEPADRALTEDSADQTSSKETASLEEDKTGYRAILDGRRAAEGDGAMLLRRFVKPPVELVLVCHLTKRALQIGEDVAVTNDEIPNVLTGARGLTSLRCEIVGREETFRAGELKLTVSPTPFIRPAFIGPDVGGSDDYDTASAADKEQGIYIAPDAGNFADDGSPYEIG